MLLGRGTWDVEPVAVLFEVPDDVFAVFEGGCGRRT